MKSFRSFWIVYFELKESVCFVTLRTFHRSVMSRFQSYWWSFIVCLGIECYCLPIWNYIKGQIDIRYTSFSRSITYIWSLCELAIAHRPSPIILRWFNKLANIIKTTICVSGRGIGMGHRRYDLVVTLGPFDYLSPAGPSQRSIGRRSAIMYGQWQYWHNNCLPVVVKTG